MSDATQAPLRAYRLLPGLGDFRTLHINNLLKLMRWQTGGSPEGGRPTGFSAEWAATDDGDPRVRPAEFPSGYPGAPVLSRRVADLLRDELCRAGSFEPLDIADGPDSILDAGEYVLYLVQSVVDCLDTRRSSKPKRSGGEVKKAVFRPEAFPADLPAWRLPEFPTAVYWNGWAVDRLKELLGDDLEARLIWSEDPALAPHPDPWGVF
ncbi:hypothetical protein QMK19_35605 [Streptomyces sp. H10-C2]|uniref:hypothetical protein n=1 Tax=unclassified Streptomyces TaxID=2593676 RepID=UPI0024BA0F58|nr:MULTISPECIES: hypothetical protein [unclassified Streptomyces]MDJ0346423.1 hypothetical protein [Streptomyces sp. PH10-H1]MDJ0374809.1 hypothetical protein [Streptomyces sp. H10-C2]